MNLSLWQGLITQTLPFKDKTFDIVVQSTVFSSILNRDLRFSVAKEMLRVLKPSGIIIWYDFRYSNPYNPNVTPMRLNHIFELFGHHSFLIKSLTLIPQVARRLAGISYLACRILEAFPFLRSHYLVVVKNN